MVRIKADPDAEGNRVVRLRCRFFLPARLCAPGQGIENGFKLWHHIPMDMYVRHECNEFISSNPRCDIISAEGQTEGRGQVHQNLVTEKMAVCIIDGLEIIYVNQNQRPHLFLGPCVGFDPPDAFPAV